MNESGHCPQCGQSRMAEAPEELCRFCQRQLENGGRGLRILRGVDPASAASAGSARWPGGPGALEALAHAIDPDDSVRLRPLDDEPDAPVRTFSHEAATVPGRYHLSGEVSRAESTVVLRARDSDLGRDLDMKVLLGPHREQPGRVRRFVREGQILGQLQHPGVPSVYELGVFPDKRPYLAMAVLQGRPFADVLAGRTNPDDHRPAFLRVFEQVCQTLAYAHARGVRHRALDAASVIVGPFGEVQVSDWGSAEVLSDDETSGPVDGRDDVFRLGSLLTEILTGTPAVFGEHADASARLDAPDIDPGLRSLARACLSPEPSRRPADAQVVFQAVSQYHAALFDRLRASDTARVSAETACVSAEAQAVRDRDDRRHRERRHRWMTAGAVAAGMLVVGLPFAAVQRHAPVAVAATPDQADKARPTPPLEPAPLDKAVVAAVTTSPRMVPVVNDRPKRDPAVTEAVAETPRPLASDRHLIDALTAAFDLSEDDPDGTLRDLACGSAFRAAGLVPDALTPDAVASRWNDRPATALRIATLLDDWAEVRRTRSDRDGARRLTEIAGAVDPDPTRGQIREALLKPDLRGSVAGLASSAELDPESANLLGRSLASLGDLAAAQFLLQNSVDRNPDDARLNRSLAEVLARSGRTHDAVRFDTAARALTPGTGHALAHRLARVGQTDAAVSVFRDLARLRPDDGRPLLCLGLAFTQAGRADEAASSFDSAIALFRKPARLHPDRAEARANLGLALLARQATDAALAELREALRLDPSSARFHCDLGSALEQSGEPDAALAEFAEAVRLNPSYADAHRRLGHTLVENGRLAEAVASLRTSVRLRPDSAAFNDLGEALALDRQFDDAATAYRESIRLDPVGAEAHNRLGVLLFDQCHDAAGAVAEFRATVGLKPELAQAHFNLGNALKALGKRPEALSATREAIRLNPEYAEAHVNLGLILKADGRLDDAVSSYRTAIRLRPDLAEAHHCLGNALTSLGDLAAAAAAYSEALRLKPGDIDARKSLESVLKRQTQETPHSTPG